MTTGVQETLNTPMGVQTYTNYGTGVYMPDNKAATGIDAGTFMQFLKGLNHDQFLNTISSVLKDLPSQYTKQGYGKIWSQNPEAAWKDFTNTADPSRAQNVANALWNWSPQGQWWSSHAGLGHSPGKDSTFDKLFDTTVTTALAVGGGAAGASLGAIGSGVGAGFSGGFTQGTNPLESGLKGAGIGGITGGITQGISNIVGGYNPNIANSIWSENATINPLVSTALQASSSTLGKLATRGIINELGLTGGTTSPIKTIGEVSTNMAGIGDMTVGQLTPLISGGLDAWLGGVQRRNMSSAYDTAQNLIMQPSPEQAAIRQKTMGMINDPASFFQDPLYQAAFGQGQQAIERSQSARGMLGSGNALAELQKYGQTFGMDMYNQRLAQLAGLSGITQDPYTRASGAKTLLEGENLQSAIQGSQLQALTSGASQALGQDPLSRILSSMGGGSGGGGISGTTINDMIGGVKDWFNSSPGIYGGLGNDLSGTWLEGMDPYAINTPSDPGYVPDIANMIWG